ncbi:L-threonine 3-dehydrogenase [Bythopirellula goksoeyrii]|uniref:L-threonine 3-dehydrogenase n=1 Tax=Bythopirellula goksoeyrii TaxID=1400387 RepID=A0A5B9QQ85_9BACT|nr:L-threonine 3-dehydrogenase [Bythopirellula goksoeyrii]QEG36291.1 L-threonine 3-dehydrogenase [Bythopirellula goksoeyrii]
MQALIKKFPCEGLWLEEVPEPTVGVNDVLIRVHRTGICGTDIHIYNWDKWAEKTVLTPLIVGHEFVGEVVETGSNVSGFTSGDIVSGEGHVVCGQCRNCLAGRRHLCSETSSVGINRSGAFAEYISIPSTNVWRHAPKIDLDIAAIFDPFGNAVHSALAFPLIGEDVVITGAGPIGVMATAVVRHAAARHIVVVDPNSYRRQLASIMGATLVIDPRERDLKEIQAELGMVEGFDVGIEMSGSTAALRSMISNMCHGGSIAILGIPGADSEIDWSTIVLNMLTIRGICGREMYETWYKMTVMLNNGLDISSVITHRFHHREYQKAFEAMKSGESGKIVLDWSK